MTNQQAYSPYRRNVEIVKGFFAKPLTLFIAIVYALLAVYNFITRLHIANGSFNANFDFISIIMSIAFFMLYFRSKSRNPNTSYKAPLNMLTIVAIINIVLVGLLILVLPICFAAVAVLGEEIRQPVISLLLVATAIITPVIVIGLIYGIALLLFAGSVKKSVSTVFLYNKGATALGVSSILLVVTSISAYVITAVYLPTIMSDFILSVENLLSSYGSTADYEQIINSLNNTTITTDIKSIIETSINIILNILMGIFALSYRSYINKHINFINYGNVPQQPQSEFSAPITDEPSPDYSFNQSDNPYIQNTQNVNNPYPADVICSNCGTHCHPKAVFCPGCGEKLK